MAHFTALPLKVPVLQPIDPPIVDRELDDHAAEVGNHSGQGIPDPRGSFIDCRCEECR